MTSFGEARHLDNLAAIELKRRGKRTLTLKHGRLARKPEQRRDSVSNQRETKINVREEIIINEKKWNNQ